LQDFSVELSDAYQLVAESSWASSHTFRVAKSDFEFYDFIVHPEAPARAATYSFDMPSISNPHEVADAYISRIAEQVVDFRMIQAPARSSKYLEKGAIPDDSKYILLKAHVRTLAPRHNTKKSQETGNRDLFLFVIQRKFIPPMMDRFQNIVLLFYSRYDSSSSNRVCHETLGSLSLRCRADVHDTLVMQSRADALMLTEETFSLFKTKYGIEPSQKILAYQFCASVVNLLERNGVSLDCKSDDFNVDIGANDDPMHFASKLESSPPQVHESDSLLVKSWKVRVWRYLGWCVDGGLNKSLTVDVICAILLKNERRLVKLAQVTQTLLYFRETGQDFKQVALALKIQDTCFMESFLFNHRIMEAMLSNGYIKYILDNYSDLLEYPKFVVRLLKCGEDRDQWGYTLQYTVCKELARGCAYLSTRDAAGSATMEDAPLNDLAVNTVVPALIEVLSDDTTNEKIKVLVVSSLVNFTKNNSIIKNKVMAHGTIQTICSFLYSKHDDLVRHACSLLNNCTKSEQYRTQVAKFNAIDALLRLIQRSDVKPYYRSTHILIQACAVLGNLATDSTLRQGITEALGLENATDAKYAGTQFEQSVSIRVFADILVDRRNEILEMRSTLRMTIIFVLKNLCIRHDDNKRTIGKLAIDTLCGIIATQKKLVEGGEDFMLVDVALRCIYVLAFDRNNCKLLKMNHIDKTLIQHQAVFSDIVKQIQMKLQRT